MPCSLPPATTSVCSCAGSSGFCVPSSVRPSQPRSRSKPPKKCSSMVLHGRLNNQVALVEESRRRMPVERNQSGLKVDQLVGQLVVTELHSSSGFAAEFDCLLLDAIK